MARQTSDSRRTLLGVLVAALALVLTAFVAPAQAAQPGPDVAAAAVQRLSWSWLDGSTKAKRTFRQDEYTGREAEIAVVVWVAPELPQRQARLEVKQGGKWRLIDDGTTDLTAGEGRVTLYINPICQSGNWCRGTFKLRIKVLKATGGYRSATKTIKVKFVPSKVTPTPTPQPSVTPTPTPSSSEDCSQYPQGSMDWYLCMHDPGQPA